MFKKGYYVKPRSCFVIMPFKPPFEAAFLALERVFAEQAWHCYRLSSGPRGGANLLQEIWKEIQQSSMVIAVLGDKNTNVLYETGLAHACGADVVLVAQSIDEVPSDLRGLLTVVQDWSDPATFKNKIRAEIIKRDGLGPIAPRVTKSEVVREWSFRKQSSGVLRFRVEMDREILRTLTTSGGRILPVVYRRKDGASSWGAKRPLGVGEQINPDDISSAGDNAVWHVDVPAEAAAIPFHTDGVLQLFVGDAGLPVFRDPDVPRGKTLGELRGLGLIPWLWASEPLLPEELNIRALIQMMESIDHAARPQPESTRESQPRRTRASNSAAAEPPMKRQTRKKASRKRE